MWALPVTTGYLGQRWAHAALDGGLVLAGKKRVVGVNPFRVTFERDGTGIVSAHFRDRDGLGSRLPLLVLEGAQWGNGSAAGKLGLTREGMRFLRKRLGLKGLTEGSAVGDLLLQADDPV